jgi:hypothetical protein
MSLSDTQGRFSLALSNLISRAVELGYVVSVRDVHRSVEEQERMVKDGKSKTMHSAHLESRAADLVLYKNGVAITGGEEFRPLGIFWENLGGRWGGRFGLEDLPKEAQDRQLGWDSCHFEFR